MAEQTLEDRRKISRELEDIYNSLVAASQKVARVQMETEDDPTIQDTLSECVASLSVLVERVQGLASDFEMETARRQNEGEL